MVLLWCLNFGAIILPKRSELNFVNSILDWFSFLFRPFPIIVLPLTSSLSSIVFFMLFIITLIGHFKACSHPPPLVVVWSNVIPHKKGSRKLLAKGSCNVCISFWAFFQKELHMRVLYHAHFCKALNPLWALCQAATRPCSHCVQGCKVSNRQVRAPFLAPAGLPDFPKHRNSILNMYID